MCGAPMILRRGRDVALFCCGLRDKVLSSLVPNPRPILPSAPVYENRHYSDCYKQYKSRLIGAAPTVTIPPT